MKTALRLFLVFVLVMGSGLAPTQAVAEIPGTYPWIAQTYADIEYANVKGHSLKLDLYLPKDGKKPFPLVIYIHGGAWCMGDKRGFPPALNLVKEGFAVACINYRFSNEDIFPAQIYDCKAAVRFLRAHVTEYGINPDKFGAWGDSAGGHLVSLLGTTSHPPQLEGDEGNPQVSSAVQAVCNFYGPANLVTFDPHAAGDASFKLIGVPLDQYAAKAKPASPIFYITAQACPFLIVHGDKDNLVPLAQSQEFYQALQKAGVNSTLFVVPNGGHGFSDPAPYAAVAAFFHKQLIGP